MLFHLLTPYTENEGLKRLKIIFFFWLLEDLKDEDRMRFIMERIDKEGRCNLADVPKKLTCDVIRNSRGRQFWTSFISYMLTEVGFKKFLWVMNQLFCPLRHSIFIG